jgi:hypothetical protein
VYKESAYILLPPTKHPLGARSTREESLAKGRVLERDVHTESLEGWQRIVGKGDHDELAMHVEGAEQFRDRDGIRDVDRALERKTRHISIRRGRRKGATHNDYVKLTSPWLGKVLVAGHHKVGGTKLHGIFL